MDPSGFYKEAVNPRYKRKAQQQDLATEPGPPIEEAPGAGQDLLSLGLVPPSKPAPQRDLTIGREQSNEGTEEEIYGVPHKKDCNCWMIVAIIFIFISIALAALLVLEVLNVLNIGGLLGVA